MARGRIVETDGTGNDTGSAIGNGGNIIDAIDPADIDRVADRDNGSSGPGRDDNNGGGTRKRGRPRGSGTTASSSKKATLDLSSAVGLLIGAHSLFALKIPEMNLDEKEAERMVIAANNVLRHYPVNVAQKSLDYAALIGAVGWIYGTRIIAINKRLSDKKKVKPSETLNGPLFPDATVTPFRQ